MMAAVGLIWDLVPIPKKAFPDKYPKESVQNIAP
jgi:hypothetical protein